MMFGHWFPPYVFRSSELGTGSQFDIRISKSVFFLGREFKKKQVYILWYI